MYPSASLATVIGRAKEDTPASKDAPPCWSSTKTVNVASHLLLPTATYPSRPLNPTKITRAAADLDPVDVRLKALDPVDVRLKAEEVPATQKIEGASKRTPMSDPHLLRKASPSTYLKELRSWPDPLNKNLFLSCSNKKKVFASCIFSAAYMMPSMSI